MSTAAGVVTYPPDYRDGGDELHAPPSSSSCVLFLSCLLVRVVAVMAGIKARGDEHRDESDCRVTPATHGESAMLSD